MRDTKVPSPQKNINSKLWIYLFPLFFLYFFFLSIFFQPSLSLFTPFFFLHRYMYDIFPSFLIRAFVNLYFYYILAMFYLYLSWSWKAEKKKTYAISFQSILRKIYMSPRVITRLLNLSLSLWIGWSI